MVRPGNREPNNPLLPTDPLLNLAASAPGAALYNRPPLPSPDMGGVIGCPGWTKPIGPAGDPRLPREP